MQSTSQYTNDFTITQSAFLSLEAEGCGPAARGWARPNQKCHLLPSHWTLLSPGLEFPTSDSQMDERNKCFGDGGIPFQTGDSLGKGIPPSPNHHSTYISMPWFQAHPVVLRVTVIFGCFMGVVPQGRAYGGYSAAFSQSAPPLPGSSPPPSHPPCLSSGRREGS